MSRLVVVSNRVPIPGDRNPAAGGLAVGLADAVTKGSLWFGWSGRRTTFTSESPAIVQANGVTYATIDIGEADYRRFYTGFANGALYPLLLYRLGLLNFRPEDYAGYRAVNRAFATALAPLLQPDDMIWVHDYQLLAVGYELRACGVQQRIGFFLHTPFVPPPLFCALPRAAELLEALCACDVIGFHTHDYRDAFLQCVRVLLGVETDSEATFTFGGRTVQAIVAPIGIDVASFTDGHPQRYQRGCKRPGPKPGRPPAWHQHRSTGLRQRPAQPHPGDRPAACPLPRTPQARHVPAGRRAIPRRAG